MGETVTRKLAPLILFVIASLFALWSLALVWMNRDTWVGEPLEAFGLPVVALAFAVVGLIVTRGRSANPVGWIMLLLSAAIALMVWGSEYALRAYTGRDLPFAALAAYVVNFSVPLVLASLAALAVLFPSGELGSRFRAWMMWFVGLGTVLTLCLALFAASNTFRTADVGLGGEPEAVELAPPIVPLLDGETALNIGFAFATLFLFVPLGVSAVRLTIEFVKGPPIERQQLKWVVYVLVIGFGLMGMEQIPSSAFSGLNQIGGLVILVGVPVAMGIAITRYRLYEIDRIVSRTVTYAVVAGLLALIFALGVVFVPSLVPGLEDSAVLVALSTLGVAALFNPVRKRVQLSVDRRFNRSRYNAERVVEDFTGTLRDRVDPDGVADGWIGVVSEALEPSRIAVWVRKSA